ncbi:glycosyltransferase family 2 protein [Aureliella helgolandensis]|uniref:Glucosyl-3-phosphoglycerate synthase n=1 Tax=Aureliella helgolandensis TaxID=2527968 RepID=A0A518GDF7_9BACT|nr:glycosyltransferase family 2 protein [Aureliella helgolandensis]QDV26631.1 Glucosyl-3-phosphoglycerate synthase [Aureliella helgolandensis]
MNRSETSRSLGQFAETKFNAFEDDSTDFLETVRDLSSESLDQQFDSLIDLLATEQNSDTAVLTLAECEDETQADTADLLTASTATELPSATQAQATAAACETLELSIVMPCLDEADTVGNCILKAQFALEKMGIRGEVIVADNGSTDDSVRLAEELGARVVHVTEPGYGAALMGGIEAARGRFVVMGDADDSYDFSQAHRFYNRLCEGAELVQGCRLPSGGGRVMPGAMPWLHQYGNPALTWLVQKMFKAPIHDVYCGMRGFSKDLYERLDQRCTGMEFATEMIIKSTLFGAKIAEVPIVLHRDGRQSHRPHLRTFRDGWRTLRFFLLQSPRWTFLAPGALLAGLGGIGYALVLSRANVAGIVFDVHTLLVATLGLMIAAQLASFALLAKTFAASEGLLPLDQRVERFTKRFSLERMLSLSALLIATGGGVVAWKSWEWAAEGFGALDYSHTMRWIIPAAGAIAVGAQFAFSSFLMSVLRLARR